MIISYVLKCRYFMTQINLSMKQTHRCRELAVAKGEKGVWEEWIGSLGLADAN